MGDKTKGICNKFNVSRVDKTDEIGGKHHGCDYFVLDITHDQYAKKTLLAYADACETDYPLLAHDLRQRCKIG